MSLGILPPNTQFAINFSATFLIKCSKHDLRKYFNPSQPSVVFHIQTNHLIYTGNQMTGFYMKCNSGLKWVNSKCRILING